MSLRWFYANKEHTRKVYVNADMITHIRKGSSLDKDDPQCVIGVCGGDEIVVHEDIEEVADDIRLGRG